MRSDLRIRSEKIWVEEDWTEESIATALVRVGVPNSEVVLGFYSPKTREHTDFAAA